MVIIAGSANSEIASVVKEGTSWTHFYIGRNIILFGYHIHHFYFGILLIGIAGWIAITGNHGITREKLALTYGFGLGLLMDEIGLLLTWGDYNSSLSYLLGVFLLGIIFSGIYFPRFWRSLGKGISWIKYPACAFNRVADIFVGLANRFTGGNSDT